MAVSRLLTKATERMARMASTASRDSVVAAAEKATRKRVSDARLRTVAEAYRAGGIEAVMKTEHVGERQAWRLKARAIEAGLLFEEEN